MNPLDHHLVRLFRAAAEARRHAAAEAPWSLEARVLAQWRTEAMGVDEFFPLPLFRRALVLACALALMALVFNFRELTQRPPDEVVIINSPVAVNDLP